jgi:hypothetical protein
VSGSVRNNGNCVHEIPGFCRTLQGARRTQSGSETRPCLNCEYQAELRMLQAAFVLQAAIGGNKRIPTRDLAKQLTFQSVSAQQTNSENTQAVPLPRLRTTTHKIGCASANKRPPQERSAQKSPRSGFRSPASKDPRKNGFKQAGVRK